MARLTIDSFEATARTRRLSLIDSRDVGADAWTETDGGFGSGTEKLATPTSNNNSKTSARKWTLTVDDRHIDASSVVAARGEASTLANLSLVVNAKRTGTPQVGLDLDVEVYVLDDEGAAGSNLVSTGTVDLKSTGVGTWAEHTFAITGATIGRGDLLSIVARVVNNDTGGSGGGEAEIGGISLVDNARL
jgi:hypothetical protein